MRLLRKVLYSVLLVIPVLAWVPVSFADSLLTTLNRSDSLADEISDTNKQIETKQSEISNSLNQLRIQIRRRGNTSHS